MATSTRGRGSSRTGSTSRNYSFYGSNWGTSTQSGAGALGSSGSGKRAKTKRTSVAKTGAAGYKGVCNTFERKINSYRTLMDQTKGAAKYPRPKPTMLNTFANWVNKGAVVQTVSPTKIARWAKSTKFNFNAHNPTPSACKNVLCAKFGKATIKAVCRGKTGAFLVVTAPTCKGRTFNLPR